MAQLLFSLILLLLTEANFAREKCGIYGFHRKERILNYFFIRVLAQLVLCDHVANNKSNSCTMAKYYRLPSTRLETQTFKGIQLIAATVPTPMNMTTESMALAVYNREKGEKYDCFIMVLLRDKVSLDFGFIAVDNVTETDNDKIGISYRVGKCLKPGTGPYCEFSQIFDCDMVVLDYGITKNIKTMCSPTDVPNLDLVCICCPCHDIEATTHNFITHDEPDEPEEHRVPIPFDVTQKIEALRSKRRVDYICPNCCAC